MRLLLTYICSSAREVLRGNKKASIQALAGLLTYIHTRALNYCSHVSVRWVANLHARARLVFL